MTSTTPSYQHVHILPYSVICITTRTCIHTKTPHSQYILVTNKKHFKQKNLLPKTTPPITTAVTQPYWENTYKLKCYSHHSSTTYHTNPTPNITPHHSIPLRTLSYHLPKKHPKQVTEKALYKKCKKQSCTKGCTSTKKTLPQKPTKQATMHTRRHAQTTHISQHDAFNFYHR